MALEFCKFIAKCPGSLMIMGEHAVLHGSCAMVAAIDKYISVELIVQKKQANMVNNISIVTDVLKFSKKNKKLVYNANLECLKKNIKKECEDNKYFNYVLAVINYFYKDLVQDKLYSDNKYIINISSDINPYMGLGSSAAVTAATIAVFLKFLKNKSKSEFNFNNDILKIGYKIINQVQGSGSGADLAASVYGNVIRYKILNHEVKILAKNIPLLVVYSGYKMSTKEVLKIMAQKKHSLIYKNIFDLIDKLVEKAQKYIKSKNWQELGHLFNIHYGMQESLGVSDQNLADIVYGLRNTAGVYGAKISGSGLGDCVIGLVDVNLTKQHELNVKIKTNSAQLNIVTTDVGLKFL